MIYTKEAFKREWESDNCNITFEDVVDCAKAWGLYDKPKCCNIHFVRYDVLKSANCSDVENYNPIKYFHHLKQSIL